MEATREQYWRTDIVRILRSLYYALEDNLLCPNKEQRVVQIVGLAFGIPPESIADTEREE